jgi:hypothetical protein
MNLKTRIEKSINIISSRLYEVELLFLSLAGNRLKEIYEIKDISTYYYSADTNKDLRKLQPLLNQAHKLNVKDMAGRFNDITAEVYSEGKETAEFKSTRLSPLTSYRQSVNPLLRQAVRNYEVMAKSTTVTDTYKKTIRQYVNRLTNGGEENAPSAMRKAVKELISEGIATVEYKNGRKQRLDSAVRRDLMSEFTEIVQGIERKLAEEIGADGWEISAHEHCAVDHEALQGHIFTNEEFEKLQNGDKARDVDLEKYEAGEADYLGEVFQVDRAIGQYNCRHIAYPFLIGISVPSFTDKELEKIKDRNKSGVEFHGKKMSLYEAEQEQRKLETAMRYERENLNLLKEVRDTDPAREREYKESRARLAELRNEYKELGAVLEPHAMRMKMERSYIPKGSTGGDSGGLRDKGEVAQNKYANTYYEAIRNRRSQSDITAIAKNTGFSIDQIREIREHIFINEHNLGDGDFGRFIPNYRMGQAWQRMEQGKGTNIDIMLLNHELYEKRLMDQGYDYITAHAKAHEKFPWSEKDREEK